MIEVLVLDTDLGSADWQAIVTVYLEKVEDLIGKPFPQDPYDQLWGAIAAVFASWTNERAKVYRKLHHIPEEWGTAVNVQSMVFGNMGDTSATGVCFTRNPSTGENVFYGEFLVNAQGEDVVGRDSHSTAADHRRKRKEPIFIALYGRGNAINL